MTIIPLLGGADAEAQHVALVFNSENLVKSCIVTLKTAANGIVKGGSRDSMRQRNCKDVNSTTE